MTEAKKSRLDDAIERLEELYGKGSVLTMDSKIRGDYDVISTGSIGFDWKVLGIGGFAKKRMYELMGWEGSGKSTVCGHAVAECQKKGGTALYVDGEHCLDKIYFQALGVDTSKLIIAQPDYGEEGFNMAVEACRTGDIDLIIIDSDSSLLPKIVIDGLVGEAAIGRKARLNSDAYPKLKQALVNNNVCVIVVSQYREKIGVMYGSPTTTQGGHALKFYSDCRIEIARTSFDKTGDGDNTGNVTRVKTTKNKTFSPYKKTTFNILYGKGIDTTSELVELGVGYNILKKSGSWYSYEENKLGQGANSVRALLNDNSELFDEIKGKIMKAIRDD